MRILVTGSRNWSDRALIYRTLDGVCEEFDLYYPPDEHGNTMPDPSKFTIVHGDCPTGADHWADQWCIGNFFEAEKHPADWSRKGRGVGFRRNAEMVNLGADLVLAFQRDRSRGTQHTINLAVKAGIEVRHWKSEK